jgi:hypothetical protein
MGAPQQPEVERWLESVVGHALTLLRAERDARPLDNTAPVEQAELPFYQLARCLSLSREVQQALLFLVSPYLNWRIWDEINARMGTGRITLRMLETLIGAPLGTSLGHAFFSDDASVRRAHLVELCGPRHEGNPLDLEVRPTRRLLQALEGQLITDERLHSHTRLWSACAGDAIGIVDDLELQRMSRLCTSLAANNAGALMLISGPAALGKTRVASALAAQAGYQHILRLEFALLPSAPDELRTLGRLLECECELFDAVLTVKLPEQPTLQDEARLELILSGQRPTILTCEEPLRLRDRADLIVDVQRPTMALRRRAWEAELVDTPENAALVPRLAARFPIGRQQIERAVAIASCIAADQKMSEPALALAAETQLRSELTSMARLLPAAENPMDPVMAPELRAQLDEIIHAIRMRAEGPIGRESRLVRGRGTVALFNGPPGTGKTIAAEYIARKVALPLYRIDTSAIVDRYVGETEKRLTRLFYEASVTRAMLLFDEADSLFGKRTTEVRNAVDRHANSQTNVLLQLLEEFEGVAILTTNLKTGLDSAFCRRILFKVAFDLPDVDERLQIWRAHVGDCGIDAGELRRVARTYRLSGGDIKNAALRASLSAGAGPLTIGNLERAVVTELESSGTIVAARASWDNREMTNG